ncbi:LacI family DNA-binding transcriptional regulator [Microbacterium telephonicum]|uniref:LacI family transcriptional regulator n=1 Tax=Microbacterium telephonicum TaxID=1714841 RepID=A0A498CA61_9MICO|nr:LacI family DNA-binding transcriptional regulator [Microbacterium telephonicum]RLK52393.1 LacI family transcriptional regulator [Microbacterium telephonicum]
MAVSVKDVAQHAGVSVGTVSNVLNRPDKVSAATVERVQAAIAELGFVRNDAARQLRAGRSRAIGLVVLDLRNPFFTDVARGAEQRAATEGLSILVAGSDEQPEREAAHLDLFEQQRVRGMLVTPTGDTTDRLARLRDHGIPAVLVDRTSDDPQLSSVAVDDVEGGRVAAAHLLALGHRRLAFAGGPLTLRQVADRRRGAQHAVDAQPGAELEHLPTDALTVEAGRAVGRRLLARPRAQRPRAVFAANDLVALGILQSLVMTGDARVPDDIALIGYDDIDFAAAAVVPLTSIRQPAAAIGATAVDLLLAMDAGAPAEHVEFTPELVVRASTAGS